MFMSKPKQVFENIWALLTIYLFVDFTKAFDYLVHDVLWFKLIKIGIRGNMLNIIRSMYMSVRSRVKYSNMLSGDFLCCLCVR